MQDRQKKSPECIDLLATTPSLVPFVNRVKELRLSPDLEQKVLFQEGRLSVHSHSIPKAFIHLTADEEKELATEVLLLRHQFTELVLTSKKFRQATLTVIQNIYLFKNRRIFFGTISSTSSEEERKEALLLFSTNSTEVSFSLAKTLQHLILGRVWNRILSNSTKADLQEQQFIELHAIVEKLNTIRNIYIILTTGLIKKLASRINYIYRESVTREDAIQIGSFGIARAAYRYHPSSGVRFSRGAHCPSAEFPRRRQDVSQVNEGAVHCRERPLAGVPRSIPSADGIVDRRREHVPLQEVHASKNADNRVQGIRPLRCKSAVTKVVEDDLSFETLQNQIPLPLVFPPLVAG